MGGTPKHRSISTAEILRRGVEAVRTTHQEIHTLLRYNRPAAIEQVQQKWKDKDNVTTAMDVFAERALMARLYDVFEGRLRIYGEESLRDQGLDLSAESEVVALVDMVDGTDLATLGIWLWCSAVVFFHPPSKRILAAVVGDTFGRVYYATGDGEAFVTEADHRRRKRANPLASSHRIQPATTTDLGDAFVCFYGQKYSHLAAGVAHEDLLQSVHRIYNFAGNPMMVKVADGTMDAVFEPLGQLPHDVVPGAFIATSAGATLVDLEGRPISLGERLIRPADPASRMTYVLACTERLAEEVSAKLTGAK